MVQLDLGVAAHSPCYYMSEPELLPQPTAAQLAIFIQMKVELKSKPVDCPQDVWDTLELPPPVVMAGSRLQRLLQQKLDAIEFPADQKGMIQALHPLAVVGLVEVMTNPRSKPSDILTGSQMIFDHSVGKPKQEIEHSGSLAIELMRQADEYIKTRDATPKALEHKPMDKIEQAADDLLKEYMPEKFVVGKKGRADDSEEDL